MTAQRQRPWRADIDGLRAIAVMSVVLFHAFPALLPGGFIGVDVFFVISGYLITGNLLKEHSAGRYSLVRFYERRVRRLFPALSVVLATVVVASFLISHPSQVRETAKLGVASALSVGNVLLWRESGYFDTSSHLKPLLNLWSLGVEEQFYFFWPLLLALLASRQRLIWVVAIGCLASLVAAEIFNESAQAAVFYLPMFRAWQLGAGALLSICEVRGQRIGFLESARGAGIAAAIGVGLIIASALLLNSSVPFPGIAAVPPVLGSALVLWSGGRSVDFGGATVAIMASRPFVYVGRISYSLYLWHWPLLTLPVTAGLDLLPLQRIALVILAFLISGASYLWVEMPARQAVHPKRAAVISCVALAASGLVALAIYIGEVRAARSPERADLVKALSWPDFQTGRANCPAGVEEMTPHLAYCRASSSQPVSRVVWGDSHADHLYSGLAQADGTHGWLLLGHMSCPPVAGVDVLADESECRLRSENALRWIEGNTTIKTVVMGMFGYYGESTDVAQAHRDGPVGPSKVRINGFHDRETKTRLFSHGLRNAVGRLIAAGKTVVIVIDVPELPFAPADCFLTPRFRIATNECVVPLDAVAERQRSFREIVSGIVEAYPTVRVVDPLPVLCGPDGCGPGTRAAPTYRDSHHLSTLGSAKVGRQILDEVNR